MDFCPISCMQNQCPSHLMTRLRQTHKEMQKSIALVKVKHLPNTRLKKTAGQKHCTPLHITKLHHVCNLVSGYGVCGWCAGGGRDYCMHRNGYVEYWRSVRQPCNSCLYLRWSVEVLCATELRIHRMPTIFHHPRPTRYFHCWTQQNQI